jgi:hypothetical protein
MTPGFCPYCGTPLSSGACPKCKSTPAQYAAGQKAVHNLAGCTQSLVAIPCGILVLIVAALLIGGVIGMFK